MTRDIEALLAKMTLEEKASLTAGVGGWSTKPIARLGLPAVIMSDGPAGVRGPFTPGIGRQVPSLCIPCGSALGATWNPELVERLGRSLGREARAKTARILLAPTVNIHRSPLAGRNFECFSEDPLLSGKIAAAYVRGVQSEGVVCTVKHFAGNDAEFQRMTIDVVIDERTLREITLLPFELAVREGGALGIMTAYNRLNGTYCAESAELLGVLRDEWGFEGFVVTDWFAAATTQGAVRAGLDLQMPGPDRFYGAALGAAVRDGAVSELEADLPVRRLLTVLNRIGALDDEPSEPGSLCDEADLALAVEAAAESMVLLRNEGVLPLDSSKLRRVAVIGPNAEHARIMGGGSAEVAPYDNSSPLAALRDRFGPDVEVRFEPGCEILRTLPAASVTFEVEVFASTDWSGEVSNRFTRDNGNVLLIPGQDRGLPRGPMSFRATGHITPDETGPYEISLIQIGGTRVRLDGRIVIDGIVEPPSPGQEFFGMGSQEVRTRVELEAGRAHEIHVEYQTEDRQWAFGARIGCVPVARPDLLDRAVALARDADAAIVVVGTNNDWESEGFDRDTILLPGAQAELIERVAAVNAATIVVVNAGAPVSMDWARSVPGVLQVWFGGQGMGPALAGVLCGDTEPSGRLPTTFPVRIEDNPSFGNFPGDHGQVRYGEGVLTGYRGYEARRIMPQFAFGHGLSYTSFSIGTSVIEGRQVRVAVTNTGARRGAEVVQCYVGACQPRVTRPPKELKAFRKVWLDAGESTTVTFELDDRAFAYWDPGDRYYPAPAPAFSGPPPPTSGHRGWRVDPGDYSVHIGRSSADIAHVATVTIT